MILAAPALLGALLALPLLWWLLRATPPSPRLQDFPAIRLLTGLRQNEETPARTPWWLLALRLLAAGLIVVGVAGPVLQRNGGPAGRTRPLLLVVDDGWASAHDWQRRLAACDGLLADAARASRQAALLTTALDDDGAAPSVTAFEPAAALRAKVAALHAHPWSVDRAMAARALGGLPPGRADVAYVGDGVAGAADRSFDRALHRIGAVDDLRDTRVPARLLLAPVASADGLLVRLVSAAPIRPATVLAIDGRGGALATVRLDEASRSGAAWSEEGRIDLPIELRNQLARLVVVGAPTASTTRLLDESDRRRPVGLLDGDTGSDTPLIGSLFYVARGLEQDVALRRGGLDALLSRPLSVLIAADRTLADPQTHARIESWVRAGGMLVRFAGPKVAAVDSGEAGDNPVDDSDQAGTDDPLLPVSLMPGSRALGGAMSWGKPQRLAPFAPGSPFDGLRVPAEVTVSRQVLARPSLDLAAHTWVMLADRTPLVTERRLGRGRVVLFHVTANADWSNLPLSGLFVQMLERLTRLAAGIASPGDRTLLAPELTLDANGTLGAPTQAAIGLAADAFGTVSASPRHPPGLYGGLAERRSLNLADAMPPLAAETAMGRTMSLERHRADLAFGPWLVGAACLLLAVDLVTSLAVRGLLGRAALASLLAMAMFAGSGRARATETAPPAGASPRAALETELAYVVTGHDDVDHVSHDGLAALSDYVNARTAAVLGTPAAVVPGRDDLSFYPLIYWPVLPDAAADPKAAAALDAYMRTGGVVLVDTEGGDATSPGSGAGFAPGAPAALRRVAAGLDVPPLTKLSASHVLAHSFYLLRDFPGRFVGAPVWVEQGGDPSNDGVSTMIIGANSWAAAWATGSDGQPEFSALPDGEQQRLTAFRFGVNMVMYALTGNYKSDQVHVPALLQRLGQDGGAATSAPDDGQ